MTAEEFEKKWAIDYPETIPIQHYFKHDYNDRWFRIHSLPESKRYAENDSEWAILLHRQNKIISDLLGDDSNFLLVTGEHSFEGHLELHPLSEVNSIAQISFTSLDTIDLNQLSPGEYEIGQVYKPMFSAQIWNTNKFDDILKDIAEERLRAFFLSIDKGLIIAPYDGGVDIICKDTKTRNIYKEKYFDWLSQREDGL
jgi:hypothetical protein